MCSDTYYLSHHSPCSNRREDAGAWLGLDEEGELRSVPPSPAELGKHP